MLKRRTLLFVNVIGLLAFCAAPVWAQTIKTLEWTAPTTLEGGAAIPVGETLKYRVWAGDTETTLAIKAEELTVPSVLYSDLALAPTDVWLAVEVYSDVRVGTVSTPVKIPPYGLSMQLTIMQTLGP